MKNLKILFTILFVSVMAFGLTACGQNNNKDNDNEIFTYNATGKISSNSSSLDLGSLTIVPDYNNKINEVLGGSNHTIGEKDSEVIAACDAVFESHKSKYPDASGHVDIIKYVGTSSTPGENPPSTVLKTYNY